MAATKKGSIFRVTGLPADQPDDALKARLKAAIDGNLSEEERSKILVMMASIVPSCYDSEREKGTVSSGLLLSPKRTQNERHLRQQNRNKHSTSSSSHVKRGRTSPI